MSPPAAGPRGSPLAMVMAAGCCATLLGVGLQRFAYAPLVPAMVQQGWLSASAAGLLGAANFAGYVLGGLAAPFVARRLGTRTALRGAMLVASICFALCATGWGLIWMVPWRTLAGMAGGLLMVLAGPAIQGAVPPERRGFAAGVVFTGVGLGIAGGAAIVPAVLPAGVAVIWLALSAAGFSLTALSWKFWPDGAAPAREAVAVALPRGAMRLVMCYALCAAAATPHMVWWPDFIARALGRGTAAGATSWLVYGVGAIIGPSIWGRLADRAGARRAMQVVLLLQVAAIAAPLLTANMPLLTLAAMIAGATAIGTTAMALTLAREIGGARGPAIWRLSTISWGAAQVASGFLLVWLFAQTGSHLALFGFGVAAAVAALAVI